jgi:peptide/nickel transport system substrate-binding protein
VYEEQPKILIAYYGCAIVKKDSVKNYVFDPTAHDYRVNAGMYIEQ